MEKAVEINHVNFQYDNIPILTDVNLEVFKGDILGIVGPNGSAKSTLLKLMLGILKPQQGSIYLLGTSVEKFRKWSSIGYIPQKVRSINMGFPSNVEEIVGSNLYSEMGFLKYMRKKHHAKIEKALEIVNMTEYRKKLIGSLSGGQLQRVFIARAIVNEPQILFMDEPLVGVDLDSQEKFYSLMEKLNTEFGITLIMVSHDIGVITKRTNRVACLGNRRIFVHQSRSFNEDEYIMNVYGEKARLLLHKH